MTLISQIKQTILWAQGKKFMPTHLAPSYDKISSNFTENFNMPLKEHYLLLMRHLGNLNNKKVIDLGCGTGWLGKKLLLEHDVQRYHGIDVSTGMIFEARNNLSNFKNYKLEHGNYLEILEQHEEASYDIVFLTWSLKFNNPHHVLQKALRVLKPGGKLALLTETNTSQKELNNALNQLLKTNTNQVEIALPKTYLPQDTHDLTDILNNSGFSQTVAWDKSLQLTFYTLNELSDWAQATGSLAGWDQLLDFSQPLVMEELHNKITPIRPGKWVINKKILGAIASK